MARMYRRDYHDCELLEGSETGLPGIPFHASIRTKLWRKIRKYMIMDRDNLRTRQQFRSRFSINEEIIRHVDTTHCLVIHPLSRFAIYREYLLCFLWILGLIYKPFYTSFYIEDVEDSQFLFLKVVDGILFINIILEFFIGYSNPITNEVELSGKKISLRYLKSYFIVDVLGCIPFYQILTAIVDDEDDRYTFIPALQFVRFIRIKTMLSYLTNFLSEFKISNQVIIWLKVFIVNLFMIHWWACIFFAFPQLYFAELPDDSWLNHAFLLDEDTESSFSYISSLATASSHFYGASQGNEAIENLFEQLLGSICLFTGSIYCNYFLANFLQIFGSTNIAETKYDELLYELKEYTTAKRFSHESQKRLKTYYEYKFNRKFFNERAILGTLSDHLRYEILLYNCRHIVDKIIALKGLSKHIVGGIIASFKHEVFLQNDVIIKLGDPTLKLYFIANGTVTVYWSTGQELTHHDEGDFFGSIKENDINKVSIVAAETTETFSLDILDARYLFKIETELAERLNQLQKLKRDEYLSFLHSIQEVNHGESIMRDLRKGYILEQRNLRI